MIDFDIFKKRESYKNAFMHDELRDFMISKLSWVLKDYFKNRLHYINFN